MVNTSEAADAPAIIRVKLIRDKIESSMSWPAIGSRMHCTS
jgi:hypothetical protein